MPDAGCSSRAARQALTKEHELLERLRREPDGEDKADETKRMIDRVRTFAGYREYPKYHMVSRYLIYKQALLAEADRLVANGVLADREDLFFLRFDELDDVIRSQRVDGRFDPGAPGRVRDGSGAHAAARADLGWRGRPRHVSP